MSLESIEIEIKELEKRKLEIEISTLEKPLYLRASFYAVIGPTLLAVVTLFIGFFTGLFDAKNEKLQNERALLKIEETKLKFDINILEKKLNDEKILFTKEKNRIQNELSKGQKILEEERKKIHIKIEETLKSEKIRLASEKQNMIESFNAEKEALQSELEPLREEVGRLKEAIDKKNQELSGLLDELKNKEINTLFEQVANDATLTPHNDSLNTLIKKLKKDTDSVKLIMNLTEKSKNYLLKAHIYYAIYQATKANIWLNRLFEHLQKTVVEGDDNRYDVLGYGYWTESEEIIVTRFIIRISNKLSNKTLGRALSFFHLAELKPAKARDNFTAQEKLKLISLGKRVALNRDLHPAHRYSSIILLSYFLPEAYPVIIASILTSEKESIYAKTSIKQKVNEVIKGTWKRYSFLNDTLNQVQFSNDLDHGLFSFIEKDFYQRWRGLIYNKNLSVLNQYIK